MRAILIAALLALAPYAAGAQSLDDEPEVYVASVYDRLSKDQDFDAPEALYTPRLQALWKDMQTDAGDEVGRVDFFFWTNSQDWKLSGFSFIGQPVEQNANRKIVTARFRNMDRKEVIAFYWEKIDGRWRLDDVQSLGEDSWTLSVVLKYGWAAKD
jgi:hypothetical protein